MFLALLNARREVMSGIPAGYRFRLPTEAEWERACRVGSESSLPTGPLIPRGLNDCPELDPLAWYGGNSGSEHPLAGDSAGGEKVDHARASAHPVGGKRRTRGGSSTCSATSASGARMAGGFDAAPAVDPVGLLGTPFRVFRAAPERPRRRLPPAARGRAGGHRLDG
jgi:hypothetical protein